ncbi:hypothetical protein [Tropicibacter naphthalenivorans]|uniref:Uncharacterized protein n=1 Tax=Tropicibacter naphthalenivorans TaxID=441103 RepID=A0A0P1GJW3_9RHOB|nr:hypothetical protein [Tropicibacter naphthalenivorans]CUH76370.1 hypothetical protein TRN7648_00900 [Tropicibacter naphthalenivorans]SMC66381.1 hypothetical protein SAMN04488093_102719 [Tropicibacter naphthalenivorans]
MALTEHRFARVPGAAQDVWTLSNSVLSGRGIAALDLPHVRAVTLRISRADKTLRRDLLLDHPGGRAQIDCTTAKDMGCAGFDALLSAITAALPPSTPANLEQGRLPDWPKHLLGWFALVVSAALGWRAAQIGLTGDRMATVAAPMLILGAIGVILILAYRPRPRLSMPLPVTHLPAALAAL